MIIKDVLQKLEQSSHPVAQALHKGDHFKVLVIAFKQGMILKDHKTNLPAILTVLTGKVVYKCGDTIQQLSQYEETAIPINEIHSVEATADSLCLLTQG